MMFLGVGLMTWSPLTMSFYKALGKNPEESIALALRSSMKVCCISYDHPNAFNIINASTPEKNGSPT